MPQPKASSWLRSEVLHAEARGKARQGQGRLGDGEGRAHFVVELEFVVGLDAFHRPEVDGAADDHGLLARFHVDLQRRLSVHFDSQVHHVAPLGQAVGRGVGPAAGHVDAHAAAAPYNLVSTRGAVRGTLPVQHVGREPFAQEVEGPLLVEGGRFRLSGAHYFGAEHGIVDARHQRHVGRGRFGQRKVGRGKLSGHVLEVRLVKHAAAEVLRHQRQRALLQPAALGKEAGQVGLRLQPVGREARQALPEGGCFRLRPGREEPVEERLQFCGIVRDGEELCRLQVVRAAQG